MDLTDVLARHATWLRTNGAEGKCANLTRANLTRANLTGADLAGAYLADANLADANLAGADLTGADLTGADLTDANLADANLTGADLTDANLADANLADANLADANLTGANLTGANLTRANLTRANLTRANLAGATLPPLAAALPTGEFVAWKKVRGDVILTLRIGADARRTASLVGRKCRADAALVVAATHLDGTPHDGTTFQSLHDARFTYTVGAVATEPQYDDDIRVECTRGVHFFATREEAVAYR